MRSAKKSVRDLHATLSDVAYGRIRKLIVEGAFSEDERLLEISLSKQLGMSRTPVRQAMHRLINEGLLTHVPHRGVAVARYDDEALLELYWVREEVEALMAGRAAGRANAVDIAQLRTLLDQEAQALVERDVDRIVQLNDEFHAMLCAATHNRFLARIMQVVNDAVALFHHSTLTDPERARQAHEEHEAIFEAVQAGDEAGAAKASRRHSQTNFAARLRQRAGS